MAKMNMIGAALVAASAIVAGCCDNCKNENAEGADVGQTASAKDPNEAVLVVNGAKLTRGELDSEIEIVLAAQGMKLTPEQEEYYRQNIMNQLAQTFLFEQVLVNKAKAMGYEINDEDVAIREAEFLKSLSGRPDSPKTLEEAAAKNPLGKERALSEFRNGVLIDKMLKAEVSEKNAKDYTADALKILEEIKAENDKATGSEEDALKKINELKATLDATPDEEKAAKFAELAKAESACPSGKRDNGSLGEFTRGMMVKEFEDVAFAQEIGKISDPVKTRFGYHLILTTAKTPAVEATDDAPATPEKVTASHILIKVQEPQEVPTLEQVVKFIKSQDERRLVGEFIEKAVREASLEAAADFKHFIPAPEAPAAPVEENAPVAVE